MTDTVENNSSSTITFPYQRVVFHASQMGLCNRLRTLCACLCLSHLENISLQMFWVPNESCDCQFDELYNPVCDMIASEGALANIISSPNTLYVTDLLKGPPALHQQYLKDKISFDDFWQQFVSHIRALELKPYFQRIINEFINQHWSKDIIGLHIRRTDHENIFSCNPDIAPKLSSNDSFFKRIEAEIAQGTSKFFMAVDNYETKDMFQSKFPEKILTYSSSFDPAKLRQTSVQDAVIDLYLLSRTTQIIGSYYSSFSEYASYLGGILLRFP